MVRHIDKQTHYYGKAHAMQSVVRVMMPAKEQRGLERPKLARVAHVTRDSDTTFKVKVNKGQGHQAAFLTTVLAHQAA